MEQSNESRPSDACIGLLGHLLQLLFASDSGVIEVNQYMPHDRINNSLGGGICTELDR